MADCKQSENTSRTNVRHDWYQTETHVIVHVLHKNIKETDLKVDFQTNTVSPEIYVANMVEKIFVFESGEDYNLHVHLSYEVVPAECTFKLLPSKVEIKLKKKEGFRWEKLEGDTSRLAVKNSPYGESGMQNIPCNKEPPKPPKNWDKVVSDITNSEEFKAGDDDALNALFQKIYSEGSDEVRKAMNKSFVESNGTVLSTNWDEVKADKVDCKPPDGVEWKRWDS